MHKLILFLWFVLTANQLKPGHVTAVWMPSLWFAWILAKTASSCSYNHGISSKWCGYGLHVYPFWHFLTATSALSSNPSFPSLLFYLQKSAIVMGISAGFLLPHGLEMPISPSLPLFCFKFRAELNDRSLLVNLDSWGRNHIVCVSVSAKACRVERTTLMWNQVVMHSESDGNKCA